MWKRGSTHTLGMKRNDVCSVADKTVDDAYGHDVSIDGLVLQPMWLITGTLLSQSEKTRRRKTQVN